jgi:hypothetical protein
MLVLAAGLAAASAAGVVTVVRAATPAWKIVPSQDSSSTQKNAMTAVSCPTGKTGFCMAVGGYYTPAKLTEIQKWNGTAWAIVSSPNATGSTVTGNYLNGVSCVSATFCVAAGYYTQNGGLPDQSLIEQWNGTAWTVVSSANVASVSNDLNAVSCSSPTFCIAAGETVNSSFLEQTLTDKWNGTTWTVVPSADTGTALSNFLWGVSCTGGSSCMADGYYDDASGNQLTLIERWKGTSFAVMPSPNPSTTFSPASDSLWSVSCVKKVKFCMAAGDYTISGNVKQTLIEEWTGTTWTIVASPNTSTTQDNGLYSGVSCASTTFCMDATFCCDNTSFDQTLVLQWTGSWTIVPSPDTSTSVNNRLQAASCPTVTFCFAAGQYGSPASSQNLVERWK